MSLNGLDDAKVKEAHQVAVAEPGGWFLLTYASRDEIELFARGNGGIVEIRNNLAQYEDSSPLYGFLRYRRRNVIIKYLPEDCSRLVQARTAVHFNAVCDHFAPCDTAFSIASPKELKDTTLSAACSLHTASGSTSSSTSSLRRRRLMEIAEEEEEEERERKRQSVGDEGDIRPKTAGAEGISEEPVTLNSDLAKSPEGSNFAGTKLDPPEFVGVRPSSPAKSFDESTPRLSSQTTRSDLYSYSSYPYSKPRVKLGPRPSLESRPKTSAGSGAHRPVSSIPAGLKASSKGSKKTRTDDKSDGVRESPLRESTEMTSLAASIPIPENSALEIDTPRPHTSSGAHGVMTSSVSVRASVQPIPPPSIKSVMTPEKARLMKAMKLREKKKRMVNQPGGEARMAEVSEEQEQEPQPSDATLGSAEANTEQPASNEAQLEGRTGRTKADSGIGIDVGNDQASIDTTDSHPSSPVAASSDIGDSTKASSLSEPTDETIHPNDHKTVAEQPEEDEEDDDSKITGEQPEELPAESITPKGVEEPKADSNGDLDVELPLEPVPQNVKVAEPEVKSAEATRADGKDIEATSPFEKDINTDVHKEIAPPQRTILPISKFSASSPTESQTPDNQTEQPIGIANAGDLATSAGIPETSANSAAEEEKPQAPELKIPTSKFSTKENKSPTTSPTDLAIPFIVALTPEPELEITREELAPVPPPKDKKGSQGKEQLQTEALEIPETDASHSNPRTTIEPIRTDLDKRQSVVSLVDDDALMEELQSATLQEAKPISVSKSPLTPVFPPTTPNLKRATTIVTETLTPRVVRTSSNPLRGPLVTPGDVTTSSARAVSSGAAYLHKITQQQASDELRPKSASKLGSSISQRIRALEGLSGSSSPGIGVSLGDGRTSKERPQSTFFSVRKVSREPSRSPSVMDRKSSLTRATTPGPAESLESSPEVARQPQRNRSESISSRLSMFEGGSMPRGRPDSIQVTARIVREPGQSFPKGPELKADPADYPPLNLQQPMLVVDHQKAVRAEQTSLMAASVVIPAQAEASASHVERKPSLLQRRFSTKSKRSPAEDRAPEVQNEEKTDETEGGSMRPRRRSSLSVVKDFIKDRRDSMRGIISPSADNVTLTLSTPNNDLASPPLPTPSRSPSRPPSVHHNTGGLTLTQRLSFSSRRSSIDAKSPGGFSATGPAPSIMTEGSVDSDPESRAGELKSGSASPNPAGSKGSNANRTSRFLRRLSNPLGGGRKNSTPAISPTVAEEDAAEVEAALAAVPKQQPMLNPNAEPSIVAFMGDVNVQFPDNLLWKRRAMCLDNSGFLILSANPQGATSMTSMSGLGGKDARPPSQGNVRRYHMSEFRPPYTPEIEVQELPNSVVLDLVDGSVLQVACEDRSGQLNVLHILQEAHQSHTSYGH